MVLICFCLTFGVVLGFFLQFVPEFIILSFFSAFLKYAFLLSVGFMVCLFFCFLFVFFFFF